MSSMRNAVARRPHRERGQLAGREKWGILEKHKDYSLRARDYNAKKAKLQRLREKAQDRNPDEFAYGMMSEKSGKQGKHGARGSGNSISMDAAKLLKTQDAGYLRTVGERVRREVEQLEHEVRLQEGLERVVGAKAKDGPQGNKTLFVENKEQQKEKGREVLDEEDDDSEGGGMILDQKPTEPRKSQKQIEAEKQAAKELREARRLKKRAAEARKNKLEVLRKQHEDLQAAEQELEWQRGKMEHSVGGVNKNGVKWKVRERKR